MFKGARGTILSKMASLNFVSTAFQVVRTATCVTRSIPMGASRRLASEKGLRSHNERQQSCGALERHSPRYKLPGAGSTETGKGHLEVTLAERVALLSWRLHRVTRYETETIALLQEQVEQDIHIRGIFRSFREGSYASTHPVDIRLESKHHRKIHNALKRFPSLAVIRVL